ncbi:MAG TPA: acyl dehydratase, partial [Burkholderiales bacterium]|nr:acyl dehydratase [Burkholderiales bacterium]
NLQGDTTFISGKVVKKYVKDRCALLDIEMAGKNQRGELSSPGFATVMLPARDINTRIPTDGTVVDLDLPPIR